MPTTPSSTPFHLSPVLAASLAPSPTLHINERVAQMWREGRTVYHLGFGESRFPVHPIMQEALRANVHQKSYLAGLGLAELRTEIAQFYTRHMGVSAKPSQVMVGPGSKSLLYAVQMALNADLILPTPCWVSYAPQARLLSRGVYPIPASPQDGYALSLDALDTTVARCTTETKILLLTSPNNPTGQMHDPAFLEELADYCQRNRLVILSDEIYALTTHGHRPHLSPAAYYPEGTVVLGGLSKHLSLGGWRLGVAIVPDHPEGAALMKALQVIASEIWSTPTAPIQYAAIRAYGDDPEILAYIRECAQIHALRTQHLWQALVDLGVSCAQPDGGFYLFPNFDRWREPLARLGVQTSTDLAAHLLDEYQIATLPGTAFSTPPQDLSLRLASSYVDMEDDAAAQAVLDAYRADPNTLLQAHHPNLNETIRRLGQFIGRLA